MHDIVSVSEFAWNGVDIQYRALGICLKFTNLVFQYPGPVYVHVYVLYVLFYLLGLLFSMNSVSYTCFSMYQAASANDVIVWRTASVLFGSQQYCTFLVNLNTKLVFLYTCNVQLSSLLPFIFSTLCLIMLCDLFWSPK